MISLLLHFTQTYLIHVLLSILLNEFLSSCEGGFPSAAWSYYERDGLVTGGNYDTHQVNSLSLSLSFSLPPLSLSFSLLVSIKHLLNNDIFFRYVLICHWKCIFWILCKTWLFLHFNEINNMTFIIPFRQMIESHWWKKNAYGIIISYFTYHIMHRYHTIMKIFLEDWECCMYISIRTCTWY